MAKLVIVESPKKAKTISGKLDRNYKVISTKGHIKDLPKKRIGIDIHNKYECEWEIVPGKEKLIRDIIKESRSAEQILLASDPDREGEAISYHIYEELKSKNPNIKRIVFNEITRDAVISAIKSPRDIDYHLFESQKARRILDRLVGFLISPLLMYFLKRKLSAGRVQSIALKLIIDREKSILSFIPEEYWKITALFSYKMQDFEFELKKINGKKASIIDGESAHSIAKEINKSRFIIKDIQKDSIKRNPPEPFKTSTLQQEANIRFGFSGKRTMMIAQGLYEGKSINNEEVGLITYMRTDSVRVSEEARALAHRYIKEILDQKPAGLNFNKKSTKQKIQDAHEAIRPANPFLSPDKIAKFLSKDEYKLYDLIWRRYIASFLDKIVYSRLTVFVEGAEKFLFDASFMKLMEEGFSNIYKPLSLPKTINTLPEFLKGDDIKLLKLKPKQYFTEPPNRWTEAGLIKALEKEGIGRPSTYATILDTLKKRGYIKLEKKTIVPLEIGFFVSNILDKYFQSLINIHFTADMEAKLDEIEKGKEDWLNMIDDYYKLLHKTVNIAKRQMQKGIETEVKCPECGNNMAIKFNSTGEYLSCTNYPACKTRKNLVFDDKFNIKIEQEGDLCPLCNKPLVIKKSRYGKFYGCSSYPDCKYTKPTERQLLPGFSLDMIPEENKKCPDCNSEFSLVAGPYSNYLLCSNAKCRSKYPLKVGIKCPGENCQGDLIEKHKNDKPYYACSNYPKCRITVPYKPIDEKCPKCGYRVLVEGETKTKRTKRCPRKGCRYRESIENQ